MRPICLRSLVLPALLAASGCQLKPGAKPDDAGTTAAAVDAAATVAAVVDAAAASTAPTKLDAPAAKAAVDAGATKAKGLSCAKGEIVVTEAMSPFTPFCTARCKKNADCPGSSCRKQVLLNPDLTVPKPDPKGDPQYVDSCEKKANAAPTPTGKPSAAPAPSTKCSASQHWDDINKKCRALGDCPSGYHWNDPMQTCLMND